MAKRRKRDKGLDDWTQAVRIAVSRYLRDSGQTHEQLANSLKNATGIDVRPQHVQKWASGAVLPSLPNYVALLRLGIKLPWDVEPRPGRNGSRLPLSVGIQGLGEDSALLDGLPSVRDILLGADFRHQAEVVRDRPPGNSGRRSEGHVRARYEGPSLELRNGAADSKGDQSPSVIDSLHAVNELLLQEVNALCERISAGPATARDAAVPMADALACELERAKAQIAGATAMLAQVTNR